MKIRKIARSFFQKLDFFPATQFLRYKGETQYKTATGGFVSLIIIALILTLFTSTGLDMVNQVNVTTTSNFQSEIVPSPSNITFGPAGDFMFAVNIPEYNLTDPTYTAFEVVLRQENFKPNKQYSQVYLKACTVDHFQYGPDYVNMFENYNLSSWLCPPLDYQFRVQGKISAQIYQQFSVYVKKCDTNRHNNCLSDANISQYQNRNGSFNFYMIVINTLLNPSESKDYKKYYLQDRNNFGFTTNLGILAKPEVQHYQIATDNSLFPFVTSQTVEEGHIVTDIFQTYTVPINDDTYVAVNFRKSPKLIFYNRTFRKIDDFLAYIGGLIGSVLGFFFIISSYNQLCYQISLGNKLFLYDKETKIDSDRFNIIYYICYVGYKISSFFGCLKDCTTMKIYQACSDELQKQLDISYLIKRIIFLEKALDVIFSENELISFHLQDQITLEEAKQLRQKFKRKNQQIRKEKIKRQKSKQPQQDFIYTDPIDKIANLKDCQSQMSLSSYETIKSNNINPKKDKLKTQSQNQKRAIKNTKILINSNQFSTQKRNEQIHKTSKDVQNNNSFEGMASVIGDVYFQQSQQIQIKKHKYRIDNYINAKKDNDV